MKNMVRRLRREEPALVRAVAAALALLVAYGAVAPERASLWEALLLVLIPLVQGWSTRRKVVPTQMAEAARIAAFHHGAIGEFRKKREVECG